VGFGVTTPDEARALAGAADGVVVGSALVRLCEGQNEGATLGSQIEASVRALKEAVRRG
jgi:tryptophan synthase alpha chain